MIESIPLIAIFILLMMYALGMFGIIHSGILFSIGARAYAFETFRNRANTDLFRYFSPTSPILHHTEEIGWRFHYITEPGGLTQTQAVARPIVFGLTREPQGNTYEVHNTQTFQRIEPGVRNRTVGVHPAWLMIGYGLCMDAQCGQD